MWYVYILRCNDNSLYTGIAIEVEKRLKAHNQGKGARYTKTRRPVALLYREQAQTKSQALKREIEIKSLSLANKIKLVKCGVGQRFSLGSEINI